MKTDSYPEIDPRYISDTINKVHDKSIKDTTITPLPGDASDRIYYRILFRSAVKKDEKQGSVIVMKLAEPYQSGEPPFLNIQRYLKKYRIPVPDVFYYDRKRGFIFLEDLGTITLEERLEREKKSVRVKFYKRAVDLLLKMQISGNEADREECVAYSLEFDVEKLMWELDFFLRHMIEGLLQTKITKEDRKRIRDDFLYIVSILTKEKKVFTHRDYHSRNIMVKNDNLGIVDFQDARMGLCQYDLASLLRDSYLVLEDKAREELIDYYIEKKERIEKTRIDRDEFIRIFDYMSIQRNLKAIGTFSYQKVCKNNDRYLPYIDDTLQYVNTNLKKYNEFKELRRILSRYIKEISI